MTMPKQRCFPAITLYPSKIFQFPKSLKIFNKVCFNNAVSGLAQPRRQKFLNFNQSHNNSFSVPKQCCPSGGGATREKFFNLSESHNIVISVPKHRCLSAIAATREKFFNFSQRHPIVITALKQRCFSASTATRGKFSNFS